MSTPPPLNGAQGPTERTVPPLADVGISLGTLATPLPATFPATFEQLARVPDDSLDVAVGAALVARDAYPTLDVARLIGRLDDLAATAAAPSLAGPSGLSLDRAGRGDLLTTSTKRSGFRGNEHDYYDPRNSLLPDVLERKLGIPISLALVYCEVARRLGVRARGVSFPGALPGAGRRPCASERLEGRDDDPVLVGPLLLGGRRLDRPALEKQLERAAPRGQTLEPKHLAAASPRTVLVRMLINLKWIHSTRGDLARSLLARDRIITLTPDSIAALREAGPSRREAGRSRGGPRRPFEAARARPRGPRRERDSRDADGAQGQGQRTQLALVDPGPHGLAPPWGPPRAHARKKPLTRP